MPSLVDKNGNLISVPPKKDWPYLIVYREGLNSRPPIYFSTHGNNLSKFDNRQAEGFHIIGHVNGKGGKPASEIASDYCKIANSKIKPR